jgi:hypothetical protein
MGMLILHIHLIAQHLKLFHKERKKMSATNKTANYNLPEFVGTDKPSWLTDFNGAMTKIDTALHALSQGQASGVTKQYVDEQISTVTTALNNLQDDVDAITAKLKNYLTVGTAQDGITATQYDTLKVNA